jgi:polyhydroxyalkanoate synthase
MAQKDVEQGKAMEVVEQATGALNAMVHDVLLKHLSGESPSTDGLVTEGRNKLTTLMSYGANFDTEKLVAEHKQFAGDYAKLWLSAAKGLVGKKSEPVITEGRGDRRFKDEEWQKHYLYSHLKQAYLLNSRFVQGVLDSVSFDDSKFGDRFNFYIRQYVNAVSPSNFLLTNPEVRKELVRTKGKSLVKGLRNLVRDISKSPSLGIRITQTDMDAFELGKDLATTPGKVIYQNDLIQLIQYEPVTEQVHERPLLIIPPFINKFYVLDMDKKKSMVKWLTEQGYQVFIVSWVNPDAKLGHKKFEDYMLEGPIAALDVILKLTGQPDVNAIGYCIGGTLLTCTQAYLKARGEHKINSLTLFTTLVEFSEPGEVGHYLSIAMRNMLKKKTTMQGVFDGRILGMGFSMLRENALFWNYVIDNYLKGKDPAPFDILYWNSDATNLPAETFKYYLRNFYANNLLVKPGGITLAGTPINLSKIDSPSYFLATIADHIVLWQSAYRGTQFFNGPTRFVLAGSGHLAGVINPPGGKYPHWTNDSEGDLANTPELWFEGATKKEGSWWPDWDRWMQPQNGGKVAAPIVGSSKLYPVIEDAPGSYVKKRI